MGKEPEEITEEELNKLITQAGYWSNRASQEGRSGAALGAEALARLLVLNFKSLKAIIKSQETLNKLTKVLIILTVVLAILTSVLVFREALTALL